MHYVLVTGVSTGIGHGIADDLVKHGFHVFGSVRKEEDGARVKEKLGEKFTPLLFDVSDQGPIQSVANLLREQLGDSGLAGLINNAGIAVAGPLTDISLENAQKNAEKALPVSRVSQVVRFALTAERPKTRYVITADWFRRWFLQRYLPDRWFDRLLDRQLGLKSR